MPSQDADPSAEAESTEPVIRFRPSKKRKVYRQRAPSPSAAGDAPSPSQPPSEQPAPQRAAAVDFFNADTTSPDANQESEPTVIRAAAVRHQRRGVGFRSGSSKNVDNEERALVVHGQEEGEMKQPVEDRFVKHTGTRTMIDDKHMNAFIESRLSASRGGIAMSSQRDEAPSAMDEEEEEEEVQAAKEKRNTTAHGNQIQEVDLPQAPSRDEAKKVERPKRVRLGPDGKPWRGGRRKRRGSDDVARDRLVEEFLHENRLDVYDHPANAADEEADGDADERIAAQFKQQYLEDVARKQQRQKAAQQKQQQEGEVLKGPKLGGSRNDRAAVREALLKTQREGQK